MTLSRWPQGYYEENVKMKSGVKLIGAGTDQTTITATEGNVITLDNVTGITIEGFTIDGQNKSKYGIYCINFDLEHDAPAEVQPSIKIQGNIITNIWGDGIFCLYSSPLISENVITEVTSSGVYAHWRHPVIVANTITYTGRYGIQCQSGSISRITKNMIADIGGQGILCGHDSSPLIEGNTITRTASHGIECYNSSKPIIIGNQITHVAGDGVNCNSRSWPKLRENVIQQNLRNGVFCDESSLPNLGSKANPGLNQISNNAEFEVWSENPWELQAQGNWWGKVPPAPQQFHGLVNYNSWLEVHPTRDINSDGVVNEFDLVIVASQFGRSGIGLNGDVNGDGVVNVFDLVLIGSHFGKSTVAAAPPFDFANLTSPEEFIAIQRALAALEAMPEKSYGVEIAIKFLYMWLANMNPIVTQTKLLPNYPNPFNPETWIPYQLAFDADVQITIYDIGGKLVRRLDLGHRKTGYYVNRERAAYWDGRSETGEAVSSGLYFYELRAGSYSAIRRMVILK